MGDEVRVEIENVSYIEHTVTTEDAGTKTPAQRLTDSPAPLAHGSRDPSLASGQPMTAP